MARRFERVGKQVSKTIDNSLLEVNAVGRATTRLPIVALSPSSSPSHASPPPPRAGAGSGPINSVTTKEEEGEGDSLLFPFEEFLSLSKVRRKSICTPSHPQRGSTLQRRPSASARAVNELQRLDLPPIGMASTPAEVSSHTARKQRATSFCITRLQTSASGGALPSPSSGIPSSSVEQALLAAQAAAIPSDRGDSAEEGPGHNEAPRNTARLREKPRRRSSVSGGGW